MFGDVIWKIFGNRFGAVVLGVAMLVAGPLIWDTSNVTCGSRTMEPGDKCTTTRKGSSVTRSYEEQRSYDENFRLAWMAAGGVFLVGGAVRIVIKLRRRNTGPVSTTTGVAAS